MAMNRIQFQPGLSMSEFITRYGTEAQCAAAVEASRWPAGFACPRCASQRYCVVGRQRIKTFQCHRCHAQTTLTSGTIFHASKLPLRVWFQAMYVVTQNKSNVSALELMRLLGVCYRTAWRLKHKLLQAMREREAVTQLAGRVEIDDAYLGGENPGGKAGRGSENKVAFLAAIETTPQGHPRRAVFAPVTTFSAAEVRAFAQRTLLAATVVVSDGLACFKAVEAAGCVHQREVVGGARNSTAMPCFRWVNTLLGNLKTAINGTYHAFNFAKYAHRYLAEVQYRFNRRFDLKAMLTRLLLAAVCTGPRTEKWLRLAEH
jgi:transposase-like protein